MAPPKGKSIPWPLCMGPDLAKEVFANVVKLSRLPYVGGPKCHGRWPCRRQQRPREGAKGRVKTEVETGGMWPQAQEHLERPDAGGGEEPNVPGPQQGRLDFGRRACRRARGHIPMFSAARQPRELTHPISLSRTRFKKVSLLGPGARNTQHPSPSHGPSHASCLGRSGWKGSRSR